MKKKYLLGFGLLGIAALLTSCGTAKETTTEVPTTTETPTTTVAPTTTATETAVHVHTEVEDPAVPATCTKDGKTAGSHCSVCGEVIKAQEVIPATGHTYVHHDAVEPVYEAEGTPEGNVEYYSCENCDAVFDADKKETTHQAVTTTLPVFDVIDSYNPVFVQGKEIEITYDEAHQASIDQQVQDLKDAVAAAELTCEEIEELYDKLCDEYYYLVDQDRYAQLLADTYANTTDTDYYTLEATISNVYNVLLADINEIEVNIAASKYRTQFFLDEYEYETDEEIAEYVATLDPDQDKEAADIEAEMDEALNSYMTGEADGYTALAAYQEAVTKYAVLYGYDDFLSFAYAEEYNRDYTVADTANLKEYIMEYILPVYDYTYNTYYDFYSSIKNIYYPEYKAHMNEPGYKMSKEMETYYEWYYLLTDFYGPNLSYFEDYSKWIGGTYLEDFKLYFNSGNYWYSNIENENVTGYCWNFSDGTPFMFLGAEYQDMGTFIHEFGHYNAAITGADISYDIDETQSQGNEMLFYTYLMNTDIASEEALEQYINYKLFYMCDAVISGYAINELEKFIYQSDSFTQDELEAKWAEIGESLGQEYSTDSMYSVLLNYNGYYISYATSALASLEIYALAQEDMEAARTAYISVYTADEDEDTFTKALTNAGLKGVFDEDCYKIIANAIHTHTSTDDLTYYEAEASTCDENGNIAFYYCEECGHCYDAELNELTYDEIELPLSDVHTPDLTTKTEATAVSDHENGNVEYYTCSLCGESCNAEGVKIDPIIYAAHPGKTEYAEKAATCTKNGNEYYFYCPTCDKYFFADGSIIDAEDAVIEAEMDEDEWVNVAETPATTEATGTKAHWVCSDCGEMFIYQEDASGNLVPVLVTEEDLVIPMLPC